jgi:acetylglutamate kinase
LTTVLKLGGELLEDAAAVRTAAAAILRLRASGPIVVVHGGGRAIDAELRRRGQTPAFADGLRITDADTLDAVVMVLAGRTNTELVAAIGGAGGKAVGLTGADAQIGLCLAAKPIRTQAGEVVTLGLVGEPAIASVTLVEDLLRAGYVPVVASVGTTADGTLMNINADTFAAHLATGLAANRLLIVGTTAGVFDQSGRTIPAMTEDDVEALTAAGAAHSGMIAKLTACLYAASRGVGHVSIVGGRDAMDYSSAHGTRVTSRVPTVAQAGHRS